MSEDMLKMIIVDDEYLVRQLLKNCIDWNSLGVEILGEASNAQEGIDLAEKVMPDIIFTDIYMPFMDGIEFSRIILDKYPFMKIVVLTGHEEFEYAKRSVKVGVSDFLLKPINDKEIEKTVLKLKEEIKSEKDHTNEYNRLKKQLADNLPHLKEKFFNELLNNSITLEEIKNNLSYFDIKMENDFYQISVVEVTHKDKSKKHSAEDRLILGMHAMDIVAEQFKEDDAYIFYDNSQKIVILNNSPTIDIADRCERLKTILTNRFNCYVCVGIGNDYSKISDIRISYHEACDALNYKIVVGKNEIISYNDINFNKKQSYFQNEHAEMLGFYLKSGLKDKANELIDEIYSDIVNIDSIRVIAANIISIILNVITELDINITDMFKQGASPYDAIFKIDTLPEMKAHLNSLVQITSGTINKINTSRVSKVVKQVQEYIQENYIKTDLSQSNTAKVFYLNPSYLSRIFKKEIGQSFVEYLTKIRMEKAIEYLKETDMKAYQISEKIGIADPNYFCICFKKYSGMSVSDFKNKLN